MTTLSSNCVLHGREIQYLAMSLNGSRNETNRFSDAYEEPCTMLSPIDGFKYEPDATLEDATKPLDDIIPRISTYVHIVKLCTTDSIDELSSNESASIALYTMKWESYTESVYYVLNQALCNENRKHLKPWFRYLKLLLTALSRLPSLKTTVYRGVDFRSEDERNRYEVGKRIIWWGFSSCLKTRNVFNNDQSSEDSSQRTLFTIDCFTGKYIRNHAFLKQEHEIVLLPATEFEVISHKRRKNGLYVIHLKEVDSEFTHLDFPFSKKESSDSRITSIFKNNDASSKESSINHSNIKINEYITRCKVRSEILLIKAKLSESDVKLIVQRLIIDKQCPVAFLRECNITSEGAAILSEALLNNVGLHSLFIPHNTIGDDGAKFVAYALSDYKNSTLKQLCLSNNNITDEGAEYLAKMLEKNQSLTHLWLLSNKIGDRGLMSLCEILADKNKTLTVLSLEDNQFSNEANIDVLIHMVNSNQSLTKLTLDHSIKSVSGIERVKIAAKSKKNFELII